MIYHYNAIDITGEVVEENIVAGSYDDAVLKIREKGLFVVKVIPLEQTLSVSKTDMIEKLHEKMEEESFARKLSTPDIKKQNTKIRRLIYVMILALINLMASLFSTGNHYHYYAIIGIPISIGVILFCTDTIFKSPLFKKS